MLKHIVLLKSCLRHAGGLEKYATRIAKGFADTGARVTILTTGDAPSSIPHPSISYHLIKTNSWPPFLRMEQFDQQVAKWLQKEQPDLVFGMDRNRTQTHLRAGNGVHIAYLKSRILTEGHLKHWICRLNPMHRKILQLEKEAFENPRLQKLFANSQMVKKELLEHYAIHPTKIEVIHNGVEWHEMQNDFQEWGDKKQETCQNLQLNPNRFHFLFIGHGYARKGLDPLLQGLAKLKNCDVHLSIIGKDNQMRFYTDLVAQYGLKNQVRFFGPQIHIRPFYQLADALVIPSFYDPFANVTIEALAMGLFVLSSKHNGGSEILKPSHGTLIQDLLDPDSMLHALTDALRHRKTAGSAIAARQSVAHLDFSQQLHKLIEACG